MAIVKLVPAALADMYGLDATDTNVAAAAVLGVIVMIEFAVTEVLGTAVVAALANVILPTLPLPVVEFLSGKVT